MLLKYLEPRRFQTACRLLAPVDSSEMFDCRKPLTDVWSARWLYVSVVLRFGVPIISFCIIGRMLSKKIYTSLGLYRTSKVPIVLMKSLLQLFIWMSLAVRSWKIYGDNLWFYFLWLLLSHTYRSSLIMISLLQFTEKLIEAKYVEWLHV